MHWRGAHRTDVGSGDLRKCRLMKHPVHQRLARLSVGRQFQRLNSQPKADTQGEGRERPLFGQRAAVGVLRHLGQLCTAHRPLVRNTAEWPLSISANAHSRPLRAGRFPSSILPSSMRSAIKRKGPGITIQAFTATLVSVAPKSSENRETPKKLARQENGCAASPLVLPFVRSFITGQHRGWARSSD